MNTLAEITPDLAADRIELFAHEGRLAQGMWHGREQDGREIACLLGSIHPDINSPSDCPAALGPEWLHHLVVPLFDGVRPSEIRRYGLAYAKALRGSTEFNTARWQDIFRQFLMHCVSNALEAARPSAGADLEYWPAVRDACSTVLLLLQEPTVSAEKWTAAEAAAGAASVAARVAAWAAEAAAGAAEAAAGAARAAARAARAAARAAASVAEAVAWAASVAEAAAGAAGTAEAAAVSATYEELFNELLRLMGEAKGGIPTRLTHEPSEARVKPLPESHSLGRNEL